MSPTTKPPKWFLQFKVSTKISYTHACPLCVLQVLSISHSFFWSSEGAVDQRHMYDASLCSSLKPSVMSYQNGYDDYDSTVWSSSVSIVTGMRAHLFMVRFPAEARYFSVLRNVQTGPSTCSRVKRAGRELDHSVPSFAEVKNEWSCTSTVLYTPSCPA